MRIATGGRFSGAQGRLLAGRVNPFLTLPRQDARMNHRPRLSELTPGQILERAAELYTMSETASPEWMRSALVWSAEQLEAFAGKAKKREGLAEPDIQHWMEFDPVRGNAGLVVHGVKEGNTGHGDTPVRPDSLAGPHERTAQPGIKRTPNCGDLPFEA